MRTIGERTSQAVSNHGGAGCDFRSTQAKAPLGSEAIGAYLRTTDCIHRIVADIASAYADQDYKDHAKSAALSTSAV